jgi:excisionase family DNA binding protein
VNELLTHHEVAAWLKVTPRYVLRLARDGYLERIKPPGTKMVRFERSAVLAYLETGRSAPQRPGASAARLDLGAEMPTGSTRSMARRRF